MEEIIFFWKPDQPNGYLSNFYTAPFTIEGITYCHTEQYMMAKKALLFGDTEVYSRMMAESDPQACKALGRSIRSFDDSVWKPVCQDIVYRAVLEKFRQNPGLCALLLSTGSALFAEANPSDSVWGIGMSAEDPDAKNPQKWNGTNYLGKILARVRNELREGSHTALFERAVRKALSAHAGTTRKASDIPYFLHPMEAAAIVSSMTTDREIIAGALLHDVVEDTDCTAEELEREFGERVAQLVQHESENKRPHLPASETWKTRKEETLTRLRQTTDTGVLMIALGDKLSNLRAIHRDLLSQGLSMWNRFHVKDPALHGWYYTSIAEILEQTLGSTDAFKEYRALCDLVFNNSDQQ